MRSVLLFLLISLCAFDPGRALGAGGPEEPPAQGPPSVEQDDRININEAPPAELARLPGIGPARAEAIITEREKRRFRRIEDILRVPGIGRKTFSRIRHSIRVR